MQASPKRLLAVIFAIIQVNFAVVIDHKAFGNFALPKQKKEKLSIKAGRFDERHIDNTVLDLIGKDSKQLNENSAQDFYCQQILSSDKTILAEKETANDLYQPNNGNNQVSEKRVLSDSEYYIRMSLGLLLLIFGGVCAGLTIAYMGQDQTFLRVVEQSGDSTERKQAAKILKLLNLGKHWVLITLLLINVFVNETLPIILNSVLEGGILAVLLSSLSIVIFGEIIPQATCVRYGMKIGAACAPVMHVAMIILYPIAYPTAALLDKVLGLNGGTYYKKKGLKSLVSLHQTLGIDTLDKDEVTIITAVLDLKEKSVFSIMTPIENVFTLSIDQKLDESLMNQIMFHGFSRIPIHAVGQPTNFVGMLLVKLLISYDPDDNLSVSSFILATLPETQPCTSCLDILNFFQQGKSHMVIVSNSPGENEGVLGVVTLEDVIEELIGEEIIDETDEYIDVHKKVKRLSSTLNFRNFVNNIKRKRQALLFAASDSSKSEIPSRDETKHKLSSVRIEPKNPAIEPTVTSSNKFKIKILT